MSISESSSIQTDRSAFASRVARCEVLTATGRGVERAAAYGERVVVPLAREGVLYRPSHAEDWIVGEVLLPRSAGPRFRDPRVLWAAVERAARGRRTTLGLGLMLVLPREDDLSTGEYLQLVRLFVQPFLADGLPVQVDLHRKLDRPEAPAHRHAHLVVGLYPLADDRVLPRLATQWLPVIRGGSSHALRWDRIWSATQDSFAASRGLTFGVAPPSLVLEPKATGRSASVRRTARTDGGWTDLPAVEAARLTRAAFLSDPENVLTALTADWAIFTAAERDALIAGAVPEAHQRGAIEGAVRDHPGVVVLHEDGRRTLYTTTRAVDTWRTALDRLDGLPSTTCQTAFATSQVEQQLSAALRDVADAGSMATVIWADTWIRARVASAGIEGSVRHRFATDLMRSAGAVIGPSPEGHTLIAVSPERWSDAELIMLVRRASETGAALRMLVCLADPVATRPHGLWRLLAERVEGAPLPPTKTQAEALERLVNLSTANPTRGRPPGPNPTDGRTDGGVVRQVSRREGAASDGCLSPRDAWRADSGPLDLLISDVQDWAWADPLLLARGSLARAVFEPGAADGLFRAAAARSRIVVDRMAGMIGAHSLRTSTALPSRDEVVASPEPAEPWQDDGSAGRTTKLVSEAIIIERSGSVIDTDVTGPVGMAGAASDDAKGLIREADDEFEVAGRSGRISNTWGGAGQETIGPRTDEGGGRGATPGRASRAGYAKDPRSARLAGRGADRADPRRSGRGYGGAESDFGDDGRAPRADRGSPLAVAALIPLWCAAQDPRLARLAPRARELAEAGRRSKLTARLYDHLRALDRLIEAAETGENSTVGAAVEINPVIQSSNAPAIAEKSKTVRDANSLNNERSVIEIAIGIVAEEAGWSERNLETLLRVSANIAADTRIKGHTI